MSSRISKLISVSSSVADCGRLILTRSSYLSSNQYSIWLPSLTLCLKKTDEVTAEYIIPGAFEGTLTYEKESGAFSAFDYRILYVVNEADENGNLRTASMEFKADGYSWNQRYEEDLYIEPNPTVYEDPEAFLEDVLDKVIPPFI